MHEVKAFKTNDGQMFDSEIAAAEHELHNFCKVWFAQYQYGSTDFSKLILQDVDAFADTLNRFIKARGPLRKVFDAQAKDDS
jgi:hypothetical protein